MGLKYASVRQPHAVVMAPALTESVQPQGFPLKSVNLSSPVSPVTLNENPEGTVKFKCTKRLKFVETTVGMNGDSGNLPQLKSIEDTSTQAKSDDCAVKSKVVLNSSVSLEQSVTKEPDYSLLQIGGFMMNNSYPPTPGDTDNMGLQKPDSLAAMDSIFKGLSSNTVVQNDLGGAGDLGHNVDEIMQVIKNMESKTSDLEVNLDSGLQISDNNDIAGGLSTFERELLNDVDIMNKLMCVDENLSENNLAAINKDTVIKDKVDEALDRQFKVERKCQWLMRRLSKMQARAMGKQASEEINGMLQHVSNILEDKLSPRPSSLFSALTSGKDDMDKSRPVSSNISTLIRRLEQTSQQQALSSTQHHVPCKYFGSGSDQNTNFKLINPTLSGSILPKLSSEVWNEVDRVSGHLRFQLKTVETAIDSDATASSSGGESCDEMQSFNNPQQQSLPILKRASWRWSKDRAAIGSRWAWLQTQISDLEYRIRQNNDLNKQIRTAKEGVVLGGEDPPRLCDSVVVNGYHGSVPGKSADDDVVSENSCRTRPLTRKLFRKRKLFHTAGLHLTSKKAAKPSSVPCGCRPPLPTCALCTGRPDPRTEFEDVDLMTLNERLAILDPAFHPVLSLPADVSQSLHFDTIMKTSDWQLKAQRGQMKTAHLTRTVELAEDVEVEAAAKQRPLLEQPKRRYIRRNLGLTPNLPDKLKRKLAKMKRLNLLGDPNLALGRLKKRRRFSSLKGPETSAEDSVSATAREEDEVTEPHPSPVPSPTPHCSKERGDGLRRKRENSYDIDNIVIPYSVAASTRLEKLQYKEILTPKWRVLALDPLPKIELKNNNGLIRRPSQEEEGENEDMTEELLVNRHERCEQEEKKKFSTYLKLPNSLARPRGHRRADSRAESSGGNTPDPMSPAAGDAGNSNGGGETSLTSPPATPQPADLECPSRRRTISSRCVSPVEGILVEVAPYEPRTFPLSDETYEKMLRVMPPGHPYKVYSSSHHNYSHDSECGSRPMSPISDSTESAETYMEDDPNDPEWTVDESSVERNPFKR